MRRKKKLDYLSNLLEDADSLDACHVLTNLYLRYIIRKLKKLRRLFDGILSCVAVLLLIHTAEPAASLLHEGLAGAIIGLTVIVLGGFNFQPGVRSRNNSAE